VSDEHYIEVTALIGPIEPPYKLHTFDGGGVNETVDGARAQRLFETILAVEPDADVSAHVVDEDDLPDAGEDVAEIIAERDWLRTILEESAPLVGRVVELEAERDRLRETVRVQTNAADAAAEAVGNMAEYVSRVVKERDALRAIVEAIAERPDAAWTLVPDMREALQLDASPTGEDM
jgi:hypothetical protein